MPEVAMFFMQIESINTCEVCGLVVHFRFDAVALACPAVSHDWLNSGGQTK